MLRLAIALVVDLLDNVRKPIVGDGDSRIGRRTLRFRLRLRLRLRRLIAWWRGMLDELSGCSRKP